jgi:DNA gyrase subunit A
MSGEQKLKEGDAILEELEATNNTHLLVFTNQCQVYKCRASDFDDGKASQLGDYLPAKLGMDEGESVVYLLLITRAPWFLSFKTARWPRWR